MDLGALVEGLGVRSAPAGAKANVLSHGVASLRICDINEDSRTVVPGSLFIARAGTTTDGKKYVGDAVRAGAVAVLTDDQSLVQAGVPVLVATDIQLAIARIAERFYGGAGSRLDLVGVTGTNGKTTITSLVWQLLNGAGRRCGLIGTVQIDDGTEVAPAQMTTPPAIEVSRSLARMVEAGCVAAALEVSSHALDQKRADALRFRVGVFTNLTGDHLDYHKTMEAYGEAKRRLFKLLDASAWAVVNVDDPWGERMLEGSAARALRCRVEAGARADVREGEAWVRIVREAMEGMELELAGPWGKIGASVALIGRYNAMNVLQALACAWALGVSRERLEGALAGLQAPPGRLERVSTPADGVHVFVDYAHSDDSLASVLRAVGGVMPGRRGGAVVQSAGGAVGGAKGGRLWVVFGCGGDRDPTKRPRMGKEAAAGADMVVVTSDNPRREKPSDIVDQVLSGIGASQRAHVTVQVDRARAIAHAVEHAQAGDAIVIAGKGHETEQILPDGKGGVVRTEFDDRVVARQCLAARRGGKEGRQA